MGHSAHSYCIRTTVHMIVQLSAQNLVVISVHLVFKLLDIEFNELYRCRGVGETPRTQPEFNIVGGGIR